MPHNSIPGHGEFHETPAAGTPTAIAAQHAGTTADAYAAEHGQPAITDPQAAARGPLGDDRAGARGAAAADRSGRGTGRSPWYDDDRFGLAVSGLVIVGVLVAAWYVHRADED